MTPATPTLTLRTKGPIHSTYSLLKCLAITVPQHKLTLAVDALLSQGLSLCDDLFVTIVSTPRRVIAKAGNCANSYTTSSKRMLGRALGNIEVKLDSYLQRFGGSEDVRIAENKESVCHKLGKISDKTMEALGIWAARTVQRARRYLNDPEILTGDIHSVFLSLKIEYLSCLHLGEELYVDSFEWVLKNVGKVSTRTKSFILLPIRKAPNFEEMPQLVFLLAKKLASTMRQCILAVFHVEDYSERARQMLFWMLHLVQQSYQRTISSTAHCSKDLYLQVTRKYQSHKKLLMKKYNKSKAATCVF